ncbi:MAG: cysteine desulfurase family protein [Erysipelotrichaceae bacterium]
MNRYFDNASTTFMSQENIELYGRLLDKYKYNSESIYPNGTSTDEALSRARKMIADKLGVKPKEIIFTSCGSEANNLAIKGVALARREKGKHIISTVVEHSSVENSLKWLQKYLGYQVSLLEVDQNGVIDVDKLASLMRNDTILVSIMMVNNESGAIMPLQQVKKLVKKYPNCYLHVDCVQALGKMNVDLTDIDLASFSAHKIYGPKGSGFLMKKEHVQIAELISAGQQEFHLRGGTSNVAGNVLLAKLVNDSVCDIDKKYAYVKQLHDYLYDELGRLDKVVLNSSKDSLSYIINFSCLTITSQVMMNALAIKGFEVSAQSTCDSNAAVSKVIKAMYPKDSERLKGTIRISLSEKHTKEDVNDLLAAIKECIKQYG